MVLPLLITYTSGNLNSIQKDSDTVLKSLSGLHTCRFYYADPIKNHLKVRISFDNQDWCVIVEIGNDKIHFTNPWFRKECYMQSEFEDEAIVKECFVIFKSNHCDTLMTIIKSPYSTALSETMELISECKILKKPVVPVKKEAEKEIWTAYCDGLNALNKERTTLIRLNYIGRPLLYNDSRQGEIYTVKLSIDATTTKEIPTEVTHLLEKKYSISDVQMNSDETCVTIRFSSTEKLAADDEEELSNYLGQFGFAQSETGAQHILKASITFKDVEDLKECCQNVHDRICDLKLDATILGATRYDLISNDDLATLQSIVKEEFTGMADVNVDRKMKCHLEISPRTLSIISEKIKDIEHVHLTNENLIFEPISETDYEDIKDQLNDILSNEGVKVVYPEFRISTTIVRKLPDAYRQERMAFVDSIFSSLKNEASKYEYDSEKAQVVRLEFLFNTAEERERYLVQLLDAKDSLTDEFKLLVKNPHGTTILTYERNVQTIEFLEEELKQNYQGEEIKLVNGKVYNNVFKNISDPDNIANPELREQYNTFISNCPTIGVCHKRTIDSIVVNLSEDFYNGDRFAERISAGDYIFFPSVGSSTVLRRQHEAIQRINKPNTKLPNGRLITPPANPKLCSFLFSPLYARDIAVDIREEVKRIQGNCLEKHLNSKQIEAVAKSVLAPDIAFIQGPPGTGKTTVIAEIIWQEISRNPNCKILVTSQTNLAVDNALERLKDKKVIKPLRVMSEQRYDTTDALYNAYILDSWVNEPTEYNSSNAVSAWIDDIVARMDENPRFSEQTSEWRDALVNKSLPIRKLFVDLYKSNVNLIAATCSICGSQQFRQIYSKMYKSEDVVFDVVIMDEASKATPLEMAVPLVLGKKIILIGDHKQLPPLLDENSIDTALTKIGRQDLASRIQDLKESQFKKLFLMAQKFKNNLVTTLDTQYRMHKDIMQTITQFYVDDLGSAGLKCGIEDVMDIPDYTTRGSRWHGISNEPFLSPDTHAIWVNVRGREEKEYTSYKNMSEIKAIKTIVSALANSAGFYEYISAQTGIENKEIGIITFYSAQRNEIRRAEQSGELDSMYDYRIDVVDKFQGMERNIVIVSTVRSNKFNNIGFAKEIERINVAFSRARSLLIVVGDKDLFSSKDSYNASIEAMETIDIKQIEDLLRNNE